MHVRIAWEILHHQKKDNPDKTGSVSISNKPSEMHRPPSHIFPAGGIIPRPHELQSSFPAGMPGRPPYDTSPIPSSFLTAATGHLGTVYTFPNSSSRNSKPRPPHLTHSSSLILLYFQINRKRSITVRPLRIPI